VVIGKCDLFFGVGGLLTDVLGDNPFSYFGLFHDIVAMDALNSIVNSVESLNVAISDSTNNNGHRQQGRKKQEHHKATGAGEPNRSLEVRKSSIAEADPILDDAPSTILQHGRTVDTRTVTQQGSEPAGSGECQGDVGARLSSTLRSCPLIICRSTSDFR
jgi:hypothetical protein